MKTAALVTGAGRGIGAATARELHRLGHFVFLLGRNGENLREIAAALENSEVILCDLDQPTQVAEAARQATARADAPLDILVNNAGIFHTHSTVDGTDQIWTAQFQTNLLGPVRLTRALWPHFQKRRRGSIVNVSSTLGLTPTAQTSAYSAIKAAMINWTVALAQEGGPLGIRANCVCPGIVDTPIHAFHGLPEDQKKQTLDRMAGLQPLGRIGQPEDVARAVAFLAGDASAWTTGASLSVDGGIHIA